MNTKLLSTILVLGSLLSACQLFISPPTPIPSPTPQPTPEMVTPSPLPTETPTRIIEPVTPTPTPTPDPIADLPEEAIMILEPAAGSQVASPVRVAGFADPTFEQNLLMRVVLLDGTQLPETFTTIQAELGQRGPFEFEYEFEQEGTAFIQVYAVSARDGGITHLSSVGVNLVPGGPADIQTREPHAERIAIFSPATGDVVTGGVVTVAGIGLASFEQLLEIEILGENGDRIGFDTVTLTSELGEPGEFQVEVPYTITQTQPGRVLVRDRSMAHGGDNHLSSVEVTFEPVLELNDEAIMILEPAPGSQVASPVLVTGFADSTFEQNLLMRIILEDGTELPETFTTIQGDLGERGFFEFEYNFEQSGNALIQVYDVSARDGGIIHLSSVEVTLTPNGPAEITTRDPYLERIAIASPAPSDIVSGGLVVVSGIGVPSFVQLFVVDLLDENGDLINSNSIDLTSQIGEPGAFRGEIEYSVDQPQVGRVVVRELYPPFNIDYHLSSVDIMLEP